MSTRSASAGLGRRKGCMYGRKDGAWATAISRGFDTQRLRPYTPHASSWQLWKLIG